ncbi:MAG: cob(I)yrinic acid a,c-diamide adenosyltransferase [Deltaproteobacteria bacterium]|nr:cob(I)yrinic acid a,c-diamide adenosyltransferase [Candidatus Anaeroferrophillacea bacterium]
MSKKQRRGLVIVNTGHGKGKTTAALGTAFRAAGHGFNILVVQFIKGSWKYGELEAAKRFDNLHIEPMGKGFVNLGGAAPDLADIELAAATWDRCAAAILSEDYDLVICDEVNYAVTYGLLPVARVLETLAQKPESVHVILTGRDARPEIIERADLVTEMREIKHPYKAGVSAQRGIEF